MSLPCWRLAHAADLEAISAIAAQTHIDLPERPDVFAEKMRLYPQGCRVLAAGHEIAGYGIAHPWMRHQIPPLDSLLGQLPGMADCLYVHDVAVLPQYRGDVARAYVATVEELARSSGIATLALVSVYGTRLMWHRLGFEPVTPDAALRAKLASYGASATYMLRDLSTT
jgi:ribosomal protein S18 acetylase RimI-like enzyme